MASVSLDFNQINIFKDFLIFSLNELHNSYFLQLPALCV